MRRVIDTRSCTKNCACQLLIMSNKFTDCAITLKIHSVSTQRSRSFCIDNILWNCWESLSHSLFLCITKDKFFLTLDRQICLTFLSAEQLALAFVQKLIIVRDFLFHIRIFRRTKKGREVSSAFYLSSQVSSLRAFAITKETGLLVLFVAVQGWILADDRVPSTVLSTDDNIPAREREYRLPRTFSIPCSPVSRDVPGIIANQYQRNVPPTFKQRALECNISLLRYIK